MSLHVQTLYSQHLFGMVTYSVTAVPQNYEAIIDETVDVSEAVGKEAFKLEQDAISISESVAFEFSKGIFDIVKIKEWVQIKLTKPNRWRQKNRGGTIG